VKPFKLFKPFKPLTYTYAYKTSDGMRHEAAMEAPSRDEVFVALRKQGIKPIKVVAADGSKANGEVRGLRKRIVSFIVLLVAVVVGVMAFWLGRGGRPKPPETIGFLTEQTRRQVIGDAAVIEKGIRTGWADVFSSEGDRFLASFAIPGVKAGVRSTSVEALEAALKPSEKVKVKGEGEQWNCKLSNPQSLEARQIVALVEGMKHEARAYIAAGGTAVEYGKRLAERQEAEIAVYKRAEAEVTAAQKTMSEDAFNVLLEKRNDELRNLGIRPITLSE